MSAAGRSVSILGVTGSVGQSTLQVIEELRGQGLDVPVEAITAGRNVAALADACRRLKPRYAAIADPKLLDDARAALAGLSVEVGAGPSALEEAGARPADWVMSAIVGAAGLAPTMAAVRRGALVALANKECLVCAGPLFIEAAKAHDATLLPVDSEHNAIFQVLTHPARVEKITLTASGGPFRTASREAMARATPTEACAHPRWSMGRKISVDSATLMNKGLELIEAFHLFPVAPDQLEVVVHPQSIIHALVGYRDGSMLAQLANPDMRTPIAASLAWPARMAAPTKRIDLVELGSLTFERPDESRFRALGLARQAMQHGGMAPGVLSAANEIAVDAFLTGKLGFLQIAQLVAETLEAAGKRGLLSGAGDLSAVLAADSAARDLALILLRERAWAAR
jgi:1-deoxy-D-xylulose-5-phosphate reductoisomerase